MCEGRTRPLKSLGDFNTGLENNVRNIVWYRQGQAGQGLVVNIPTFQLIQGTEGLYPLPPGTYYS
jgi:hypothetical protein